MIVNAKKIESAESWRPSKDNDGERVQEIFSHGQLSTEHSLGVFKVDDPIETLVDSYDFSALHDRIMSAVASSPKAPKMTSSRKDRLS